MERREEIDQIIRDIEKYIDETFQKDRRVLPLAPNATEILEWEFEDKKDLVDVIIPDGIKKIGQFAFYHCDNLRRITIPESVEEIGDRAFAFCENLVIAKLPKNLKSIEEGLFFYCERLVDAEIPKGVKDFKPSVFYGCKNLRRIRVAEGNEVFHATNECLIKTATKTLVLASINSVIPTDGSVIKLNDGAFFGCEKIKNLSVPDEIEELDGNPFPFFKGEQCNFLNGSKFLGNEKNPYLVLLYANVGETPNFKIPSGTRFVGTSAFRFLKTLEEIDLHEDVREVKARAFLGCSSLKRIKIGRGMRDLDPTAFGLCRNIEEIRVEKDNEVYESDGDCLIDKRTKTLILGGKNSIIPEGKVEEIGHGAFSGRLIENGVVIPRGVKKIAVNAFSACTGLKEVVLPSTVEEIENYAFSACTRLKKIFIPKTVKVVMNSAFDKCHNLTVYAEAEKEPEGWLLGWNNDNRPVVWGAKDFDE